MSKQKNAIEKVNPSPLAIAPMPDFMTEAGTAGSELLREYVIPPRIKVIQKSASGSLLESFGVGDMILVPQQALIREMTRDQRGNPTGESAPVQFVPIFFYPEWAVWTDFAKRGDMPAILQRTMDPNSTLRARCNNPKFRSEPMQGRPDLTVNNVEHLNFIIVLLNHELAGEGMLLSFARGEHFAGSRFAGLVQMRKAPLYGCVFEMVVTHREGTGKGDWWGIDVRNPVDGASWITDQDHFSQLKQLHEQFAETHRKGLIQAQYDDNEPGTTDTAAVPAQEF